MNNRVAIIIPSLAGDGAERVVSNLSLNLSASICSYIIVYDKESVVYPYRGELISINSKASTGFVGKLTVLIKRLYLISIIKRMYKVDTAISFLEGPNIINIFTKRSEKVIVSVRNYNTKSLKGFYGWIYKLLITRLYNKADYIVAVSKAIKNDLIMNYRLYESKIKVIYNPYDIKRINELAAQAIEQEYFDLFRHPVIINIGRLNDQKGQWHLIRAFSKVKESIKEAKLVIIGRGELEGYLKDLAHEYGLQNDIHFLGFKDNPFKYLKKSIMFVLTSLYEGFPNALAEAMACGLPVISTDCRSGPREILAPLTNEETETKDIEYAEYGILVPVCDGSKYDRKHCLTAEEALLAASIVKLYTAKKIFDHYSELSLKRIKDFDLERIIPEYESIL